MLTLTNAALGFNAVGAEPRVEVLLALVRVGSDGLLIGDLQRQLDIPASTLSHHLRVLAAAGLIQQERQGRTTVCRPNFKVIEDLASFLMRECCSARPASAGQDGKQNALSDQALFVSYESS